MTVANALSWIKRLPEANPRLLGLEEAEELDRRIAEAEAHLEALRRDAAKIVARAEARVAATWTPAEIAAAKSEG